MSITALVMTDGRKACIAQAIPSLMDRLHGPVSVRVIHDDSGDPAYGEWLWAQFPGWIVAQTPKRLGFSGAYRNAWAWLREHDRNAWIFSTEDDFVLTRDVDVTAMQRVMVDHPNMVQIALLRQPVNTAEKAAGGIVELHPRDYMAASDGVSSWLEHRRHFTTNPSLIRRQLVTTHEWPRGRESEGRFGIDLFSNHDLFAAYWGAKGSGPWVEHIGHTRVGTGY